MRIGLSAGALEDLCALLRTRGMPMGSRDERTRSEWRARGVRVSEFPEIL